MNIRVPFMHIRVAPQAKKNIFTLPPQAIIILFQVLYVIEILIAVVEVLTRHAPNKRVVVRGSGAVDAPFG